MSKIIPGIVAQHAEEAAFLWILRDEAVRAPHYTSRADASEPYPDRRRPVSDALRERASRE